jgi:hypothetical protein
MIKRKKLPTHSERLQILENGMKEHNILIKDLKRTFEEHIVYSKEWKKQLEDGNQDIKELHKKIDKILNVQVNGRQGLEASLKDLYELTKSQRANRRLTNAFKEWLISHNKINLFLKSKIFQYISYIIIGWFVFGVLKFINVNITLEDLVKFLSKFPFPGV